MKAIGLVFCETSSVGMLKELQLPTPEINSFDILVQVKAISFNPADIRVRERKSDDGLSEVLGWDCAGVVSQVGKSVINFIVGDRVFYSGDLGRQGTYAEFHAIDSRLVGKMPKGLDFEFAASLPLTMITAWELTFEKIQLNIKPDHQSVLVIGAAGGVGTAALQLLNLIPNISVLATASRKESIEWCKNFNPKMILNHKDNLTSVLALKDIKAVDHVLCFHNPDRYWAELVDYINPFGSFSSVVPFENRVDLNIYMRRNISFHWEFMFAKSMWGLWSHTHQATILNQISTLIDRKMIKNPITESLKGLTVENIEYVHSNLMKKSMIGKAVLSL